MDSAVLLGRIKPQSAGSILGFVVGKPRDNELGRSKVSCRFTLRQGFRVVLFEDLLNQQPLLTLNYPLSFDSVWLGDGWVRF